MSERLSVGRVIKPHGIRGEVSVEVYSQDPSRFERGSRLRARERDLVVVSARPHQGRMLVTFEDIGDRDAAEELRGVDLSIEATAAAPLPEWSFYPHELEGFDVFDATGEALGTLVRVEENPANDLWVVRARDREVYVPAVRAIVTGVDRDARRITLDPPEGLFE